ncbi:MAG: LLM class flavin-dependent oxidoreductase [Actinomycetota bacterium]
MSLKVGMSANPIPPLELTVAQAMQAESDGFDSIWYPDHLMGWFPKSLWTIENSSIVSLLPSPHVFLDPTVVMTAVGAATSKVILASGVTDPIRRPPAELARTFVSLSHATQGRAILGIGAGELENTKPYGLDYRFQVSRLEEALHIIRLLWDSSGTVSFDGRFWKLDRAVFDTPAYQGELPPIWIAAHGPRMLDLVGRYGDGWYPSYPMTPAEYGSKLGVIRKAAQDAGRDPEAIIAGYYMYVGLASDHDTAHRLLSSPLAKAMALVAPSEQWEAVGRKHPFGSDFQGLRDYVPEWYSSEVLQDAVDSFELDVLHDTVLHGTVEEVVTQVEPFIEAGLQHVVFGNLAPLAGMEYIPDSQEGLRKVAANLR